MRNAILEQERDTPAWQVQKPCSIPGTCPHFQKDKELIALTLVDLGLMFTF